MTTELVIIPDDAPAEEVPERKNPPGRWRCVSCALNSHYEKCNDERHCGCWCQEEGE